MGPAIASQYTGDKKYKKKKPEPKKPTFPTSEEKEARRDRKKHRDKVISHQKESIRECYLAIKRQAQQYNQEVRALCLFQLDDHIDLACEVLTIADWAEEFNTLSVNPILDIPGALQTPYCGTMKAQGQFPLLPSSEEPGVTDVRTWSQVVWIYLCTILQYFKDHMATREGALYGGKTRKPSALVLYIMEHINPGLLENYQVQWHNIVGRTPWLAARDHMSREELDHFYHEPGPEVELELERATKDVYHRAVEDAAQWE